MSSHQNTQSSINLVKDNQSPKTLSASRWAPGGFEDQMMANNKTTAASTASTASTTRTTATKGLLNSQWSNTFFSDKPSSNNATSSTANGLARSQWSTAPFDYSQINKKKGNAINHKNKHNNKARKKGSDVILNQPRRGVNKYETSPTTQTTLAPRRIIGPLSEEEQMVKMENPFFNPEKHKGLGSSRWATE